MASAFAIGQDGIIVTNHHVLAEDEGEILGAMDAEGTWSGGGEKEERRVRPAQKVVSPSSIDDADAVLTWSSTTRPPSLKHWQNDVSILPRCQKD